MKKQYIMDVSREVLWYGKKESLPEVTALRAGALIASYASGSIRNIRIGTYEVVRMIYVTLRDRDWKTLVPEVKNEKIDVDDSGFRVSYESIYQEENIHLKLSVTITGDDNNRIVFDIDGTALTGFQTNRTGLCLLHPIRECSGNPCEITGPDGKKQLFEFPGLISPRQPMKNIKRMSWKPDGKVSAHVEFEGEIFELEDQRNWTDDSYKTYCRPLALPYPYALEKGEKIHQRITLQVEGEIETPKGRPESYHLKYDQKVKLPLPRLGISQAESKVTLSHREASLIRAACFDFYDVQILFENSWISELESDVDEANSMGLAIRLKVFFTENYEIEIGQLSQILRKQEGVIDSILILEAGKPVTSDSFLFRILEPLREAFPNAKIGGGTLGFFAALNRSRIQNKELDFISYSVNPQVHTFDNLTLVENLNGQYDTVITAKSISNGKQIYVGPVTFKIQANPTTATRQKDPIHGLPGHADVRQMSLFGAGWTLGSIKKLTEAGVDAATYFETMGEKGIIQGESDSKYPEEFQVQKGAVFPMYYVFMEILKHKKGRVISSVSSHPLDFEGMVFLEDDRKAIILANFTNRQLDVRVDGIAPEASVRKLDEKNGLRAMYEHEDYLKSPGCDFKFEQPITTIKIRPYGLVFINE
jgi:hypothetical protein